MRFLRQNGLTVAFSLLFLIALIGQAVAGQLAFNEEESSRAEALGKAPELRSLDEYVFSSDFGQAVMENWQSEYLQFALFVLLTIWLVQKGSPESKKPAAAGSESNREQKVGRYAGRLSPPWSKFGDWRTALYGNSLLIVMAVIFFGAWFAQSVTGWSVYNDH